MSSKDLYVAQDATYDLICVGFGPAQIATAIANFESPRPSNVIFLEQKPSFSWKASAHLLRSRMENAFIYDLATTRNPRSAFTYTSYLLAKDRLISFANSDRMEPLRIEFEDYLRWCADSFSEQVKYGHKVTSVIPERRNGVVKSWQVVVQDATGGTQTLRTKNFAFPAPASRDQKARSLINLNMEAGRRHVVSYDEYLGGRNALRGPREPRLDVAVVGSGSKTAEIIDDLLTCSNLGNITVVTENESLVPLQVLSKETTPPPPRLCSLWVKPSCEEQPALSDTSELLHKVYDRAYEKQVASKGQYALRIVLSRDASNTAEVIAQAGVVIAETPTETQLATDGLFDQVDALVLGCRQKSESLEEVQFKRGTVADDCRMWMLNAHSDEGRTLAKDIAIRTGEIARVVAASANSDPARREGDRAMVVSARI
ncbi:hypothetical protein BU24DRAFT_416739 [Aaosphaeria arxii CBS 175.79]|uniref:L-ornithine N(5)-monooxygenase [NAD(P)H] n=1 Tax=Aaosphaeria arxii CBS 175.79 TaxID=1450172 RepID=A0A6A5Y6Z9_9PLEO|nr:uncharacterized protein BU24DRAFT_416739 [Aaosphaeria arxii CBS 175.79]KAF2021069.1 hypothetical protein BU24DRAFT_416739 [Aaosphaeria arxii CBS 175.79]